jgi:hypothetical protein
MPRSQRPASTKLAFVDTLTNWLENSPDSQELLESLEQMATGSRDKSVEGMFNYLLEALPVPMPEHLDDPALMFGFLEKMFQEGHSERDNIGPG